MLTDKYTNGTLLRRRLDGKYCLVVREEYFKQITINNRLMQVALVELYQLDTQTAYEFNGMDCYGHEAASHMLGEMLDFQFEIVEGNASEPVPT